MTNPRLTATLHASIVGRYFIERTLLVRELDGTQVRVRWQLGRPNRWRCDVHGALATADCPHTFAAGLVLAEDLLGLTPNPALDPEPDPEGAPS